MSSTTSSDCESCDCSQCTYSFEYNYNQYGQCMNNRHVPIFATMANPLIYYAQVQPINRRQNSDRPKKDNPFMKAFKWYTQERKAICGENEVAPEKSGFANWLDNKYCEYKRDNGQQPTSNEPRARNTNTCECPKPTKTFRKLKSPWPKRTRTANDSGDVPQKCPDGSCEYILKPKELSRAASENCFHSPTSAGKSNATVVSSHIPCNAKCSRRSQSLSDVSPEKYVNNKHVETVPLTVQEGTNISCDCPQQHIEYPPPQQKVPEAVQVPSKQQDSRNQPEIPCTCQKEKVPEPVKVQEQQSRNEPKPPCTCQNQKLPEILKEPSIQLDSRNQPEPPCTCQNEKVPAITKEPSKEHDSINQPEPPCTCQKEKVPAVVKEPSKEQYSMNQPVAPCKCSRERVSIAVKLPSHHEEAPQVLEVQQEKIPEVGKVLSYHTEAPQVVEVQQEKMPEVVRVPSKAQESTYDLCCKCEKQNVPKVVQVPSEDQDPRNLPGLCCSCHVKKVPEVVQVPSQCRAVEDSCQCPEKKVVPVCEETRYETALIVPLRSAQYHGPCCYNTCKPAAPPSPQPLQPQIFCLPVKIQDRKISTPDICVAPSVQSVSPKKQKKVKQCITIATQCGEGIQSKVSSQCQHEINECAKDNRSEYSAQYHGPCCCNTCKLAAPPSPQPLQPQIFCLPVKIQDRKISTPDICVAPSVQSVSPKKQKKVKQCITIATQCGEGIQSKVSSQCQHEINECAKDRSSCYCYEERQMFDPIPIKRESCSTVAVNKETCECSIKKEVAVVNKLTRCLTCTSNGAAQTSDHSIRFENDGCSCPYPLFFKIVYAGVE